MRIKARAIQRTVGEETNTLVDLALVGALPIFAKAPLGEVASGSNLTLDTHA